MYIVQHTDLENKPKTLYTYTVFFANIVRVKIKKKSTTTATTKKQQQQ